MSISIFAPLIMADETDAEMADVSNGGRRKDATGCDKTCFNSNANGNVKKNYRNGGWNCRCG